MLSVCTYLSYIRIQQLKFLVSTAYFDADQATETILRVYNLPPIKILFHQILVQVVVPDLSNNNECFFFQYKEKILQNT